MKLTDALLGEHAVFYSLFQGLEARAMQARTTRELWGAFEVVSAALASHAEIEDDLLLHPLEQRVPKDGPLAVLHGEHEEIGHAMNDLVEIEDLAEMRASLIRVLDLTRAHFHKEEEVFFSMAQQHLGDEVLRSLGKRWSDRRQVADPS